MNEYYGAQENANLFQQISDNDTMLEGRSQQSSNI